MKQFVLIVWFCYFCLDGMAQNRNTNNKVMFYQHQEDKSIRFGFCIGLNAMNFAITHSNANFQIDSLPLLSSITNLTPGFQVQAVSVARLTNNLELRFLPGIAFGNRELSFYRDGQLYMEPQRLESSYIDLPLLLKYKSTRINNYRAFLIGGLNPRFDLAKTYRVDSNIFMDLKTFDLCYEFGGGYDFYFPYFKLTVELRGSWGIFNMLKRRSTPHPEFQNAIERLRSSMYMISFYIE
jgi:hypothetical protein